ncbi:MAG: 50S ribosomal protein L18 [Bacillota bacterium]|jgi:large subunit ribosomal protein L18|nr:50S ribosomal protein L18 [Candidatus Fermentithermobacillaceae bacterium]
MAVKTKHEKRARRHRRVRKKVVGTPERPRLNVFRSLKHIYAQIIDDTAQKTLVSASSCEEAFKASGKSGSNADGAAVVGKLIAQRALEKNIKSVVFDRGGYRYHGRVKALADGARQGGLEF